MGIFSKVNRFRERGEEPNVNNVAEYGQPLRSLFTSTEIFSLRHKIEITDEAENVVYRAQSKVLSLHDKTYLYDAKDRQIAFIEKKIFTLHERHFVTMADGTSFELSNELFHLIKDITNIEGLGWQLRGNILGLNFQLYDQNGEIIAVISQKLLSIHDKYCIDLYQTDKEDIVVAILVTLQHMMADRAAASSSGSASSSSSSSN